MDGRVKLEGGRIDALVRARGAVLRTSEPDAIEFGLAQVRRRVARRGLELEHLIFAPVLPRPLLLACVELRNDTAEPLVLDYTELWELDGEAVESAEGACACRTVRGERALADAGAVIRARAPKPLPLGGLALELRTLLRPGALCALSFAYAAPDPPESPAALVRAWRGDVPGELRRTVREWIARLSDQDRPLDAYRLRVGSPDSEGELP